MRKKTAVWPNKQSVRETYRVLSKFNYPDVMLLQQGGGYSNFGVQAAGRTSALKAGGGNVLRLRNRQALPGSEEKIIGEVKAFAVDDRRPAAENIVTVPVYEVSWNARGCQTAELFRADWNPVTACYFFQTGSRGVDLSVVTGAESRQAGADQENFRMYR